MGWDPLLWVIFMLMSLTLTAINLYQISCLTELEVHYFSRYDLRSRVNAMVVPEFVLLGALGNMFLLTGHWIMFLLILPVAFYNLRKLITGEHLTGVSLELSDEKERQAVKLVFYIFFLVFVLVRLGFSFHKCCVC